MRFDTYSRAWAELAKVNADHSHASHTLGMMLPAMVAAFRCKTVIEVGICEAFTTEVLARALAAFWPGEGCLLSCDCGAGSVERGWDAVAAVRESESLPKAHMILSDSREVDWPAVLRAHDRRHADLVLIDGSHEYDVVRVDIDLTRRVLRTRGLMVLHDCCPEYPGVLRAVNEFQANAHWRELHIPYEPDTGSSPVCILQRLI